ncbi:hypothetical protein DITRI_Ditri19aG0016800 [Diplodiscus trichospermus]
MGSAVETLCGQAYGALRYDMLGVYLQRSTIVLTLTGIPLTVAYVFSKPILILLGESTAVASAVAVFVYGLSWAMGRDLFKLSAASDVMLCLEAWYFQIPVLVAGLRQNPELALDSLFYLVKTTMKRLDIWEDKKQPLLKN